MNNETPIIVIKDLYKYFNDIKAVDGVSMEIQVLSANQSTLMKMN